MSDDYSELIELSKQLLGLDDRQVTLLSNAIMDRFGGDSFYVNRKQLREDRNRRIRESFNGRNYRNLSVQYEICERQIRRIACNDDSGNTRRIP